MSEYGCIISESFSFPKELCYLIGSFLRMPDEDRIKYMLANRDSPDVFACVASVVDELDEIFELQYGYSSSDTSNPMVSDPWRRLSLTDRIISLNSRTFRASLQLPYWGTMKTEYTLFALLRDMQDRGRRYSRSVFKWRDVFGSPPYLALGNKIRSLWKPALDEQLLIESQDNARYWSQCGREYNFIQMHETLGDLLARISEVKLMAHDGRK